MSPFFLDREEIVVKIPRSIVLPNEVFFFFLHRMGIIKDMETLDYNKSHWTRRCPGVTCRKEDGCCCGLRFIEVPSSLTEEMTPKNGDYSNAIVKFEATGEVWIYSAEGVPVKIKEGEN